MPPTKLTRVQLEEAIALDHFKRHWLALNTLCSYAVQQEDHLVNSNAVQKYVLEEHFGDNGNSPPEVKRRKTDAVN